MSEEPQPLRLRSRPQPGAPPSSPPDPPPPPPPGPEAGDAASRLRLKPRLNLTPEPQAPAEPAAPAYEEPPPPAPEAPRIKLRPKAAPEPSRSPVPPAYEAPAPEAYAPPPPGAYAPPPPSAYAEPPASAYAAPLPAEEPGLPPPPDGLASPPPPPSRASLSMPPMSVLSAPPPPGGVAGAPDASARPPITLAKGAVPKGLQVKMPADGPRKVGGKPVVRQEKASASLRKRPTLGIAAKIGIAFVVVTVAVGGIFIYKILFPVQTQAVKMEKHPVTKAAAPKEKDLAKSAAEMVAKVAAAPSKLIDSGQAAILKKRELEQAKVDAAAALQDVPAATAAPTPTPELSQSVMAEAPLSADVRVNSTKIEAVPTASAQFRTFVADASIGGVFQGTPSRALINGSIVREGQVVSNALGITFDRIDAVKKVIYFKDETGAQVSKNY